MGEGGREEGGRRGGIRDEEVVPRADWRTAMFVDMLEQTAETPL